MPDPINALQNLASQGARNPMQPQMMPMGNPTGMNQGSNLLQNLIHVCTFHSIRIDINLGRRFMHKLYCFFSSKDQVSNKWRVCRLVPELDQVISL